MNKGVKSYWDGIKALNQNPEHQILIDTNPTTFDRRYRIAQDSTITGADIAIGSFLIYKYSKKKIKDVRRYYWKKGPGRGKRRYCKAVYSILSRTYITVPTRGTRSGL